MADAQTAGLPRVSVIIPVYNSQDCITKLLDSLISQDYTKELVEMIVVDNNSTDNTKELVKKYPVTLLEENEVQSSYAARNKGLSHANNEIIAFVDADCIATENWLREGIAALESGSADLVAGNVEFFFSEKKTAAEIYDSIHYLDIETNVNDNGTAPTANLFVRKSVFDKVGMFPHVRSGGDIQWTRKATENECSLIYTPKATVKHPARKMKELLKKNFRTGTGRAHLRRSQGLSLWHEVPYTAYNAVFIGIPVSNVKDDLGKKGSEDVEVSFIKILFVGYLCKIFARWGLFLETLKILTGKKKQ